MLLFFRVVRILLANLFRRRAGMLDESVLRFRVWPADMDLNLHLNDGRFISFAGLGRLDLMARAGLLRAAVRRGWYPVVGAVMIRYRREIRWFAPFVLRSRVAAWDEKWFYFEHHFERAGSLAAIAYVRGLLRTREGVVPSADVLALLGSGMTSPPIPEPFERWREAGIP